jgi:hypothetical protein
MALSTLHKLAIGQEFHVIHKHFGVWTYEYDGSEEMNKMMDSTIVFVDHEKAMKAYDIYKGGWDK